MVGEHDTVEINGVVVDFARNTATRGGAEVRIEPKIALLLQTFLARPGETLSRDALIDAVWGGAHGADHSLTNAVSQLRRLLNPDNDDVTIVETIPKKGYRFAATARAASTPSATAALTSVNAPAEEPPDGGLVRRAIRARLKSLQNVDVRRYIAMGGLAAILVAFIAVTSAKMRASPRAAASSAIAPSQTHTPPIAGTRQAASRVIAVLPFRGDAPSDDGALIAEGFSSDLTDAFTRSDELEIIAAQSAFRFREDRRDYSKIEDQLGATHVVDGVISTSGDTIRVAASLIDTQDERRLWSRTFSGAKNELQLMRADIVEGVSNALSTQMPRTAVSVEGPAYEDYLRGVVRQRRGGVEGFLEAKALFEAAIARAPDFAQAHARLAQVYLSLGAEIGGVEALTPEAAVERARPHLQRALALTPLGLEALEAKWRLQLSEDDCAGAEATLTTALAHYPSNAAAHYRLYQARCCQGKWSNAFAPAKTAASLDPFDDQYAMDYASTLILLNQYDEAERVWRRILELRPEKSTGYRGLAHLNRFQGALAEAQNWYRQALAIDPDLIWNRLYAARNLTDMGLFGEAAALYPQSHQWEYFFARGEFDAALAAITDAQGAPIRTADHDEIAEIHAAAARFDDARALLEGYAAQTEGTVGPLFADFPELDIPAPLLVHLRRRAGDEAGAAELAARTRVFIDTYRDSGGDDYLLDVIEARLAAAAGDDASAARWLNKAIERGYRIRRANFYPEFVALRGAGVGRALARMNALAETERRALSLP